MIRPKGMIPAAYYSYLAAVKEAKIGLPMRIVQTVGDAPASAGFHAPDGRITIGGKKESYCAAFDCSIHNRTDGSSIRLSKSEIKQFLNALANHGFVGWFRDWENNQHIHAIYVNVKMKPQLQKQVIDFLNDRDGLAGHQPETFYTANKDQDNLLRMAFLESNPQ